MEPEIELHVRSGVVYSWEHFRQRHPRNSFAIDGYVDRAAAFDPTEPLANFDHHSDVNGLATRSTCGQVLVAIPLGLFETCQIDGRPTAHQFVNDCDQYVCVACWLLRHSHRLREFTIEHDLARLILVEDRRDAIAGADPLPPTTPQMRMQAWVFELYETARVSGQLFQMSPVETERIVNDVLDGENPVGVARDKPC